MVPIGIMPYTPYMSLTPENEYSGFEQELETLQANYGSEAFTRSILEVYSKDCPDALARLIATIDDSDLEGAKHAIHSLTNIMGVVGPMASRRVIETITAALNDGQLKAAVRHAAELESMVQTALASIHSWLDKVSRNPVPDGKTTKGNA